METIQRNELQEKLASNDPFVLVEVLPPKSYEEGHIPRAMNIPLNSKFDESALQALPDKDQPIVVYCANTECSASPDAGKRLEELGYTNVRDYAAGKADWKEAGLKLEASGARSN
jgi:rhodanese-related sulfurtransferase